VIKLPSKLFFLLVMMALLSIRISFAQVQLVLLKNESVVLRLNPGDEFIYRLKHSGRTKRSYVNNLNDTAVFTHHDVVPFYTIDKIYFPQTKFYNRLGSGLFMGGIALFLIDQVNFSLLQGNKFRLDRGVAVTSCIMTNTGGALKFFKKRSQRIGGRFRLLTITPQSPFYRKYPDGLYVN
jgi:hypothetical protein